MIAFGGKREKGARKEKNASIPVFEAAGAVVVTVRGVCGDPREMNVRKTVVKKKATTMMTLGGRMLWRSALKIPRLARNQLCGCKRQA